MVFSGFFATQTIITSSSSTAPSLIQKLAGGNAINGALDVNRNLYTWGNNENGMLGDGTTVQRTTPIQVSGVGGVGYLSGIKDFDLLRTSIACDTNGNVYAWGANNFGALGQGNTTNSSTPVQVKGVGGTGYLTDIVGVSSGTFEGMAVSSSGSVYVWGTSTYGGLGQGDTTNSYTPVQVKGVGGTGYLTDIIQAEINYAGIALSSSGNVYCWGFNHVGQLGDGTTTNSYTPVQVKGVGGTGYLTDIVQVACGRNKQTRFALSSTGIVYAWGDAYNGSLGQGNSTNSSTPVIVKGVGGTGYLSNIIAVSGGGYHAFALDSSGNVYVWGGYGTDGNNNTRTTNGDGGYAIARTTPVQVAGVGGTGYLSDIVAISGERFGGSALDSSGNVYAWGHNGNGANGDGTTAYSNSPVQVLGVGGTGYLNLN